MMAMLRRLLNRIRMLFASGRLDRDFAAELESHLSLHIDDNLRAGMGPDEARRAALARLGGMSQAQEARRESRGIPALERFLRDVRYGARALRAMPAFTLVAVLTLGLGIGANAAIFSVINAALFQPLPVERPEELVTINHARGGLPIHSYPDYRDFRDRGSLLAGVAAFRISPMNLDLDGVATRVWGNLVSGNYFELLGVRPVLGRTLTPADDRVPGAHPVLVLAYECWQARFAGDPNIVGRTVRINGAAFTILGVLPAGFHGTEHLVAPELWVPIMMQAHVESGNDWLERRRTHNIMVVGRLGAGVSHAQAEASLNAIAAALAREYPASNEGMRLMLSSPGLVGTLLRGPMIGFSGALLAIAGLVLLLTCTNLTGLLLARSTDRQRDTAIRLALGAGRGDLVRRSLVESALVSLAGAGAALVFADVFAALLTGWRPPGDFPLGLRVELDYRVLAFSLGLAALATFLVGFIPAISSARTAIVSGLKEETVRWRGGWHARDVIVAVQVALSTILLVGSLLVVRSLQQASTLDIGFNPDGAVSAKVDLGLQGYERDRALAFQRELLERVAALPGIDSAATANAIPLGTDISTHSVYVEGRPEPRGVDIPEAIYYQVSPGFFRAMEMRLMAGRDFEPGDVRGSRPVAVVNQAFADQLLGAGPAVGKRFRSGRTGAWIEIIGVVQNGKYQSLGESPQPAAFHSAMQWYNPTTTVVARSGLPAGEVLALIRTVVRNLDPGLPVFDDMPLSRILALPLLPARIAAGFLAAFGALALVLVLVGTYGLISYGIAQRTREICIRLAVGAASRHIAGLVLGRAAVVWAVGVTLGVAAALAGAPALDPILFRVDARDPVVFLAACAILALITAAACWFPIRRALVADPSGLLRRG
jgi:predicted permease